VYILSIGDDNNIVDAPASREAHEKIKPLLAAFHNKYKMVSTNWVNYCHVILFNGSL
jgi:hypothetical protein